MGEMRTMIVVECDEVAGPAMRGLTCLVPTSGQRRDQATKEQVLERLAQGPATAARLASDLGLTPPGLYRHVRELRQAGLVREVPGPPGSRRQERYYRASFPVVTREDQGQMLPHVAALAQDMAETYRRHAASLRQAFLATQLVREGWDFLDLALCVLDESEKLSRSALVEGGELPDTGGMIYWGREEEASSRGETSP